MNLFKKLVFMELNGEAKPHLKQLAITDIFKPVQQKRLRKCEVTRQQESSKSSLCHSSHQNKEQMDHAQSATLAMVESSKVVTYCKEKKFNSSSKYCDEILNSSNVDVDDVGDEEPTHKIFEEPQISTYDEFVCGANLNMSFMEKETSDGGESDCNRKFGSDVYHCETGKQADSLLSEQCGSKSPVLCEDSLDESLSNIDRELTDSRHTDICQESEPSLSLKEIPQAAGHSQIQQSRGLALEYLKRIPDCSEALPRLQTTDNHTVLVNRIATTQSCDLWDERHVKLPSSPKSMYPGANDQLESRWDLICNTLRSPITNSFDLEECILTYNSRFADKWSFKGLHYFFTKCASPEFRQRFFNQTLPRIIDLALQLPSLITQPVPLLTRQKSHSVTMSQQQAASLLCNAFLCTYPRRNTRHRNSEYGNFPEINFNRLFRIPTKQKAMAEKLRTILHYFERVTDQMPQGNITYERRAIPVNQFPAWKESPCHLEGFRIDSEGRIESDGKGMLQVDFANAFIGGGSLGQGLVQEEIRFCICPELIVSMLMCERMDENECLLITGAEQYSTYSGYSSTYRWEGDCIDTTSRDEWMRRCTQILAMDALRFNNASEQYKLTNVRRELNKAYCGFFCDLNPDHHPAIATGNWGCGAFRGYPVLKALLQLMAAAAVGRSICYFTFHDTDLMAELDEMYTFIKRHKLAISDLWTMISSYGKRDESDERSLFEFMQSLVNEDE